MKKSSEKKKSQTRSSIMKALNNNDTFGVNIISIMSQARFSVDYDRSGNLFADAWPTGECYPVEPCWTIYDLLSFDYWPHNYKNIYDILVQNSEIRVYTSRPENQFPEKWNGMRDDGIRRWSPLCEQCGGSPLTSQAPPSALTPITPMTFGTNSISIMSQSRFSIVYDYINKYIFADAWPEGKCSNGSNPNPCWTDDDLSKLGNNPNPNDLPRQVLKYGYRLYTSRPENQFPERWNEMLIGSQDRRYAEHCSFCPKP